MVFCSRGMCLCVLRLEQLTWVIRRACQTAKNWGDVQHRHKEKGCAGLIVQPAEYVFFIYVICRWTAEMSLDYPRDC